MSERSRRKVHVGKVVSDKMDKTIVVAVETYKKHPLVREAREIHQKVQSA